MILVSSLMLEWMCADFGNHIAGRVPVRTTGDLRDFVFEPLDQILKLTLHPLQFDHVPIVARLIHQLPHLVEAHLRLADPASYLAEFTVHVHALLLAALLHPDPDVSVRELPAVI